MSIKNIKCHFCGKLSPNKIHNCIEEQNFNDWLRYLNKIIDGKFQYDLVSNLYYYQVGADIIWYQINDIIHRISIFLKNDEIIIFNEYQKNLNGIERVINMVEDFILRAVNQQV